MWSTGLFRQKELLFDTAKVDPCHYIVYLSKLTGYNDINPNVKNGL